MTRVSRVASDFGQRMREARLKAGISQESLARSIREHGSKWVQGTVWAVEMADRPARLDEAVWIAEALGVSFSDLLEPIDPLKARVDQARHAWEASRADAQRISIELIEREDELAQAIAAAEAAK